MQCEAVLSHPFIWGMAEEANSHLATTSSQVAVENNAVPSLAQLPQPLLVRLVLQPFTSFFVPSLTSSSTSMSFQNWGSHNWTQLLRCGLTVPEHGQTILSLWPHYFWSQPGCPWLSWQPGHKLAYFQPVITTNCKSFFVGQLSSPSAPSLQLCMGLLWPKFRTLHLALLNHTPCTHTPLTKCPSALKSILIAPGLFSSISSLRTWQLIEGNRWGSFLLISLTWAPRSPCGMGKKSKRNCKFAGNHPYLDLDLPIRVLNSMKARSG